MSKTSFFTQIKLFVSSHIVPVITISAIVVVGATAGIVAIIANSQKQDTEIATSTPTEDSKNNEQDELSKGSHNKESDQTPDDTENSKTNNSNNTSKPSEPTKPATSQNQTPNNTGSTQKPNSSNNQTTTPSKPNTSQNQPSQPTTPTAPTTTPTQPSQPETPVEPEKPADNKIWGNPYIYKENGVYYCDRGNGFVKCEVPESWGCGFVEEPEPGYKPSKYGCYYVPEDFE